MHCYKPPYIKSMDFQNYLNSNNRNVENPIFPNIPPFTLISVTVVPLHCVEYQTNL